MEDACGRIRQLQHQSDAWKRSLEFLRQENVYLKNRLAEVLTASRHNAEFLEEVEQFQNQFILQDSILDLIRRDIADMDKLLANEVYMNKETKSVFSKHKKLEVDVRKLELNFNLLSIRFNDYIREV